MTIDLQKLRAMAEDECCLPDDFAEEVSPDVVLALLDEVEELQCAWEKQVTQSAALGLRCDRADEIIESLQREIEGRAAIAFRVEQERDRLREALEEVLRLAAMWPGSWEQPRRGDMGALAAIARAALSDQGWSNRTPIRGDQLMGGKPRMAWSPIKYHHHKSDRTLYVLKAAAGGWQFSVHGALRYQSEIFASRDGAKAAASDHAYGVKK